MAKKTRRKKPPEGLMPVGARLTIHGVHSATQDGDRYTLTGIPGVRQVWLITAEGAWLVEESPAQFCASDRNRIAEWAHLTHLHLRRPAAG